MYLEEIHFLVSKVLFSNCQTAFPLGLWVTSKQCLHSLEEGLKNLDKELWLSPHPLCFEGSYDCVHLGKVLFGMCMFSKHWVCRERVFWEATMSQSLPGGCCTMLIASAHTALGVYESTFNVFWSVLCSRCLFLCMLLFFCPIFWQTGCSPLRYQHPLYCNIAGFSPQAKFLIIPVGVLIVQELLTK